MRVKRFDWIEHPSDVGFRAYGRDLAEAFENAALALFEVMVDTTQVMPGEEIEIEIEAEDERALLYEWLEKLLYHHDSKGLLMSRFDVEELSPSHGGFSLKAKTWGERFDPVRHSTRTAVKAITYHLMEIKRKPGMCSVQAVVDV